LKIKRHEMIYDYW